jgi:hypothetical protein
MNGSDVVLAGISCMIGAVFGFLVAGLCMAAAKVDAQLDKIEGKDEWLPVAPSLTRKR